MVTDHVDSFVPEGIRLKSGRVLEADVVVTATGLTLKPFGGIAPSVDGETVDLHEQFVWQGAMLTGIPNFAVCIGYTNASWTLRADLTHRLVCRVLNHLSRHDLVAAVPMPRGELEERPLLDLSSGYIQRAIDQFPRQGDRGPWRVRQNYLLDSVTTLNRRLESSMEFTPRSAVGTSYEVAVIATSSHDVPRTSYESSAIGTNSYDARRLADLKKGDQLCDVARGSAARGADRGPREAARDLRRPLTALAAPHDLLQILLDPRIRTPLSLPSRSRFGVSEIGALAVLDLQFRRVTTRDRGYFAEEHDEMTGPSLSFAVAHPAPPASRPPVRRPHNPLATWPVDCTCPRSDPSSPLP